MQIRIAILIPTDDSTEATDVEDLLNFWNKVLINALSCMLIDFYLYSYTKHIMFKIHSLRISYKNRGSRSER